MLKNNLKINDTFLVTVEILTNDAIIVSANINSVIYRGALIRCNKNNQCSFKKLPTSQSSFSTNRLDLKNLKRQIRFKSFKRTYNLRRTKTEISKAKKTLKTSENKENNNRLLLDKDSLSITLKKDNGVYINTSIDSNRLNIDNKTDKINQHSILDSQNRDRSANIIKIVKTRLKSNKFRYSIISSGNSNNQWSPKAPDPPTRVLQVCLTPISESQLPRSDSESHSSPSKRFSFDTVVKVEMEQSLPNDNCSETMEPCFKKIKLEPTLEETELTPLIVNDSPNPNATDNINKNDNNDSPDVNNIDYNNDKKYNVPSTQSRTNSDIRLPKIPKTDHKSSINLNNTDINITSSDTITVSNDNSGSNAHFSSNNNHNKSVTKLKIIKNGSKPNSYMIKSSEKPCPKPTIDRKSNNIMKRYNCKNFSNGDIVWAKLSGYSIWPAKVIDINLETDVATVMWLGDDYRTSQLTRWKLWDFGAHFHEKFKKRSKGNYRIAVQQAQAEYSKLDFLDNSSAWFFDIYSESSTLESVNIDDTSCELDVVSNQDFCRQNIYLPLPDEEFELMRSNSKSGLSDFLSFDSPESLSIREELNSSPRTNRRRANQHNSSSQLEFTSAKFPSTIINHPNEFNYNFI